MPDDMPPSDMPPSELAAEVRRLRAGIAQALEELDHAWGRDVIDENLPGFRQLLGDGEEE